MRTLTSWSLPLALSALASLALPASAAAPVYRIEPVPTGVTLRPADGRAINGRGDAVGSAVGLSGFEGSGFLYRDGHMRGIGGAFGMVLAINRRAESAGFLGVHAVWFHNDGTMVDIAGKMPCWGTSVATGIADDGAVVGHLTCPDEAKQAFVYRGGVVTLQPALGGTASAAYAVNGAGQVVGQAETADGALRAALWQAGTVRDLGTLGGAASEARALNKQGQVVGTAQDAAGVWLPFIHDGESMQALPACRQSPTQPLGVNKKGTVVGSFGKVGEAFVIQHGRCRRLADLLDASGEGWTRLSAANGINDAGQIVGAGVFEGQTRAFIATPVDARQGVMSSGE